MNKILVLSKAHYYDDMKERKVLLGQIAYVSKKIMDEGWIWQYISAPVGTRLIRISSEEFEEDHNDKEIYMEKM